MRSSWTRKDEIHDPMSWELYHENAKRGRRLGVSQAAADTPDSPGDSSWTRRVSIGVRHESDAASFDLQSGRGPAGPPREGALTLSSLMAVVEKALRAAGDPDSLEILMYFNAVDALPIGLYHYRPTPRSLIHLGQGQFTRDMMAALGESRPSAASLFIVGALEKAAEIAGERGYRQALIATGRTAHAFESAAGSAGIGCRWIDRFYDREVDALLMLDGLNYSALGVLAVSPLSRDPGP